MEELRQYAFTLVAAALLCGIVISLAGSGSTGELVRILCGVVLTLAVLAPVRKLDLSELLQELIPEQLTVEAVEQGEAFAQQARADIIKSETEAYILDKAAGLDTEISVEVILSPDELPAPVGVRISGEVSPYVRSQLEEILISDLSIAKEDQSWTG